MSTENVKSFFELVSTDETLRTEITALFQGETDQKNTEEKSQQVLEQKVLPLAAQKGFPFTLDDLRQYGEEQRQPATEENHILSDQELDAVAGGITLCLIPGYDTESNCFALCFILGRLFT